MARRKRVKTEELTETTEHKLTCPHHWSIESPHGPVSRGVCKLCGEVREFKNYWDDIMERGVWRERLQPAGSMRS